MSKKLIEILPSLQSFKDNVISQLTNMFSGAEWLNDATSYTKQETIYRLLILKYGDRAIRYDDVNIFLNRLVFDLADLMPDIYAKQQVFIKNKLNEFLSDNKNRAVIIDNKTTNTRDSNSKSKLGNSSSPLNLVISDASEIVNAPITSSNLSNVKLLENYKGDNQQVNYNFVNDLIKTLNADYSLRLNEFMSLLAKHFVNVVGSYYKSNLCINNSVKDNLYQFNNGYNVNEVDYLCTENKQEINRFNDKLEVLNTKIQTKQDQINAGENITITGDNVINAVIPKIDLSNYYTKQEIDASQDAQNTLINNLSDKVNNINKKQTNNVLVLPKNSKIGVNSWSEYTNKFNGVLDINGESINLDSNENVSNNEGVYDGKSRSYINYVDFYLPKETTNLSYIESLIFLKQEEINNIKRDYTPLSKYNIEQAEQDNKINEKLSISGFNTFKEQNTQVINNGDARTLQQAKDYGDSVKPQIMDLNGGDFTWSDSYALYYKEVKPSQIPFDKVIGYSIWSTNNIWKDDFNGLALTAFVRQISSGGFNVYIMNNSKQIPAINEFRVRISYFK